MLFLRFSIPDERERVKLDQIKISNPDLKELLRREGFSCSCGKPHRADTETVLIERGAISRLPALLRHYGAGRPFLLSGHDSFAAAGAAVCRTLEEAGLPYASYVFPQSPVKPTESTVGAALMHFDYGCDAILAVGSGVINDTAKMLARARGLPYILAATAPSMDGFVSATSSMDRDGLKVSLESRAADAVIGDLDILERAPMHLLLAGVGDMLAKLVSLVGEYYCPAVAALVQGVTERVLAAAPGLVRREEDAVRAVMEGLVLAGLGMNFAGLSRPASGMEHYLSHIWDMRALAFPEAGSDLHGIQTGIATLYTLRAYEALTRKGIRPERSRAERAAAGFSLSDWNAELRRFIGPGAEAMIAREEKEKKYAPENWRARYETIESRWEEITAVIRSLPSSEQVRKLMESIGFPTDAGVIGYDMEQVRTTLRMSGDIRDKYVGSRLFRDLGVLEEIAAAVD